MLKELPADNEVIAKIFKGLCDPTRVSIIKLLINGEQCNCNLSDKLDIAQSKLSYHMKILCESGIIECRHAGKWSHYRISPNGSVYALNLLKRLTDVEEDNLMMEA